MICDGAMGRNEVDGCFGGIFSRCESRHKAMLGLKISASMNYLQGIPCNDKKDCLDRGLFSNTTR
jgi:hypothetical protein